MNEGMPPPFEVALTEDDLVGAFRLHANFRKVRPLLLAVVLLVILLGLILLISPASRLSATSRPLTLLLEGAVGILMLLVAALFAALPAIWRRNDTLSCRGGISTEPILLNRSGLVALNRLCAAISACSAACCSNRAAYWPAIPFLFLCTRNFADSTAKA